ncbi:MAG: DUF2282 domain-containing protein [Sulfurifustaceae bacterium]
MTKHQTLIAGAIAGVLGLGGVQAAENDKSSLVYCVEKERCYGVAKAGKNDCATATSSCATTAKHDFQKDAWVYVPKGTCVKLAGGSLQPVTVKK